MFHGVKNYYFYLGGEFLNVSHYENEQNDIQVVLPLKKKKKKDIQKISVIILIWAASSDQSLRCALSG